MSLQDAFAAVPPASRTKLDSYRAVMSEEDVTALDAALASTMAHSDIARVLTSQGYPVGESTVRRERDRLDLASQLNGL